MIRLVDFNTKWLCFLIVLLTASPSLNAADDISGVYNNQRATLVVMDQGSFVLASYLSVFGKQAHICECFLGPFWSLSSKKSQHKTYLFEYASGDSKSFAKLEIKDKYIRLKGQLNDCCGAYWKGDKFDRSKMQKSQTCTALKDRTVFYKHTNVAGGIEPSSAYIIKGNSVDTLETHNTSYKPYLLSRYKGKKTTVGLIKKKNLKCDSK